MPAKPLDVLPIAPPPPEHRARRDARFAGPGEKRTRYSLPSSLESSSPVGFRTRVSLTQAEAAEALKLLAMERPTAFAPPVSPTEQELFEESSLGILTARQSTNFPGHRQLTFGPEKSRELAAALRGLKGIEAPVLDDAAYTHLVLSKPYRTPFTMLLTLVGHRSMTSPFTVLKRLWDKRVGGADDIPTIGYLQSLHLGILADALERAVVLASNGSRRAQLFLAPFCGGPKAANSEAIASLEKLCGITFQDRVEGWHLSMVAQVGTAIPAERVNFSAGTARKIAANFMAFRSERIQPGVNFEPVAPDQYKRRQPMDVPDELTTQAGRAGYNAFAHWTGHDREKSKGIVLFDRVDVLTPNGKERLREIREQLERITDDVVRHLPLWADLPTGKSFSSNAARGKKAFALTGQRIYFGGLSRPEIEAAGIDWELGVRAFGACASRAALYAELMGVVDLPADCDLLAGICLMAGPVNQNDIGKQFYGDEDLLEQAFKGRKPTSLLVWTLKAKTVADPIGNEEQLLNPARKGALVELRPGPHECIFVEHGGQLVPFRKRDGRTNSERAFDDVGNFATDPEGRGIPGNRGSPWPAEWRSAPVWKS